MPKLSKEQVRLLLWLSLPSSFFEVISDCHKHDILYNGLHHYKDEKGKRYKFDIRTLQALAGNKLVDFETVYYCGLEWTRYTITDAGKLLTLNIAADCYV